VNLVACALICSAGPRDYPIGFEEIYSAPLGGFERETVIVAADEESFSKLWSQVMGFMMDKPAGRPQLDFGEYLVLAYFPGTRPTLGYRFEVRGISIIDGKNPTLVLKVTETPPGEVAAQMISYPVVMLKLARADGPAGWWKRVFRVRVRYI
jgi:hypothetical protein